MINVLVEFEAIGPYYSQIVVGSRHAIDEKWAVVIVMQRNDAAAEWRKSISIPKIDDMHTDAALAVAGFLKYAAELPAGVIVDSILSKDGR